MKSHVTLMTLIPSDEGVLPLGGLGVEACSYVQVMGNCTDIC